MEVNIYPVPFHVFGVNVGLSVVVAWCVLGFLVALLIGVNLYIRKRFSERPKGLQNVLEMIISGLEKWAQEKVRNCA